MASYTGKPKEHREVSFVTDVSGFPQHIRDALKYLQEAVLVMDELYLFQRGQRPIREGETFDAGQRLRVWPDDLSAAELKEYLSCHPDEEDAILSPFTVVSRNEGRLFTVPYHVIYRGFLERAAKLTLSAAYLLGDYPKFQHFLRARAQSFCDGGFSASDREWVRAGDAPLELIIGPIESYEDWLRNIKCEFEGILGIVSEKDSETIISFQREVAPFDAALGERNGYRANSALTPMKVVDLLALGGEARYRYMIMACNLPNNPDIQQEVGSKKTFFRQIIEAKFEHIVSPMIGRVLEGGSKFHFGKEIYLRQIVGHELSHGLTFRFYGEDFFDLAMPLEESKADTFGTLFLYFLEKRKMVRHGDANAGAILHVCDLVRQVRFSLEDAHAVGALIQWNWLEANKVITLNTGMIQVAEARLEEAYQSLGDALYKLSAGKNENEARVFVERWGKVPESLRALTSLVADIPVDIDPQIEVKWT